MIKYNKHMFVLRLLGAGEMFFKRRSSAVQWLVVGLGNPGKKYDGTRHNVGFEALEVAAKEFGIEMRKAKFDALCGEGVVDGQKVMLLKPQTYMNLSGGSIVKAAGYYKIEAEQVIVLCDDVALEPGVLRIRLEGSDGGHNGLKSVETFMGKSYMRIRIGVGGKPHPDYDMADWVLGRPTAQQASLIKARYDDIAAAVKLLMAGQGSEAMARYNGAAR